MYKTFPLKVFSYIISLILFLNLNISANSILTQAEDSVLNKQSFTKEDLVRGERLFFGLVHLENESVNCAGCHNISPSDTMNWNPSAIDISEKYLALTAEDLSRVLLRPAGEKMAEAHKDFNLTTEEIVLIKVYMDKLTIEGEKQDKPVITNLLLFIIASLLFLYSTTDLLITKKLKQQWIHLGILTVTGIFITWTLVVEGLAVGHSPEYAPDQPIKFSHAIHAGQNQTDCIYCHSYAPFSKTAGIPPGNVCMNCHLLVRDGARTGAFEIAKVISDYEEGRAVEWIKVHNLPDHVFFNHSQHVTVGKLTCQECHGPVETMERIKLSEEITMGWCIDCHRTKNVNFRENKFYQEYKDLAEQIRNGTADSVTVERIGGTECMKCHY